MYNFLAQTLIGFGGTHRSRVRVPASAGNFRAFANPDETKGSPFDFFGAETFENFLVSPKGPPSIFLIFCNKQDVQKAHLKNFGIVRFFKMIIFRIKLWFSQ